MFGRNQPRDRAVRSDAALRCSFCQKTADQVRKLIAGPAVFICDECVDVCNQIIADDERAVARAAVDAEVSARIGPDRAATPVPEIPLIGNSVRCSLCRMPMLLEDSVTIPNRGLLCAGCIGEIEASVAERRLES